MESIRILLFAGNLEVYEPILQRFSAGGVKPETEFAADHLALEYHLTSKAWDVILILETSTLLELPLLLQLLDAMGKKIPVLVLSETVDNQLISQSFALGAKDCIALCNVDHLYGAVMRERQVHQELREAQQTITRLLSDKELFDALLGQSGEEEAFYRDLLTQLHNRRYLEQRIEQHRENQDNSYNLLTLHMDAYQKIKSDSSGLATCDALLRDIAKLLQSEFSTADTIARIDEDTFALLIQTESQDDAEQLAESLRQQIELHQTLNKNEVWRTTASIGLTLINANASIARLAIDKCLQLGFLAKEAGGNQCYSYRQVLDPEWLLPIEEQLKQIHGAIDEERCHLVFQPIVSLHAEAKELYEALTRMEDASGHPISTEQVFSRLEDSELRIKIDRWVVETCIQLLASDRMMGNERQLFIILSSASVQDSKFLPWLSEKLSQYELTGEALVFEIREDDLLLQKAHAKLFTHGLKELHCHICISRFGTNEASIGLLSQFPADFIKVDGNFTQKLQESAEGEIELKTLIDSIHNSGKLTITPLVEDANSLASLWRCGANYIQGYYLQMPDKFLNYDFFPDQQSQKAG